MYCTVQSTPYTRLEIVLQNVIRRLRSEQKVSEAHVAPTCRLPGHFIYMSLHKKATIVIYLVLQSTPTYVNAVAGYSIIAPNLVLNIANFIVKFEGFFWTNVPNRPICVKNGLTGSTHMEF